MAWQSCTQMAVIGDMMNTQDKLKAMMDDVLHLNGASAAWTADTQLLGSLPELDSLAVTDVISGIERTFAFSIYDDEINADMFATVGALTAFIDQKLASAQ